MKQIFNILYYTTILLVGVIGLMLVSTLIPIPGNFEVKVVKSGSMEPAVRVGGIVVIKPAASYAVGDVITFGADTKTQIPTTHRVVSVEGEGSNITFQTKGDANENVDPGVTPLSTVHGKMVFTVPYMGYVLAYARTQVGFFLLVGVPALLVFYEEGRNIWRELRRMRKPKEPQNQKKIPKRVMGLFVVIALATSWGVSAGQGEQDTLAYYADTSVSTGNSLGAANVYDTPTAPFAALFTLSISDDEPVVIDEGTPPVEETLLVGETTLPAEEPPAEAPTPPVEEPHAE